MNLYSLFFSKVSLAKNIVISTHIYPDADGIGSQIGLCLALQIIGKKAICINEEPLLERYSYLDPQGVVLSCDDLKKGRAPFSAQETDLFIIVDTNTTERVGQEVAKTLDIDNILYIDHHPCSKIIQGQHCIDTSQAATGQLVGNLVKKMGVKFTQELALPLYTAILIDTSSFRYPTVSADTHRLIAELLDTGIKVPEAYNGIYGTKKIPHMHFLGKILASSHVNEKETLAWIYVAEDDLEEFDVDWEDTHGFVNHLLILDQIKVACMFREDSGRLKLSMRTTGAVDVGIIAQELGGGGHSHSAACQFKLVPKNEREAFLQQTIAKIDSLIPKAKI